MIAPPLGGPLKKRGGARPGAGAPRRDEEPAAVTIGVRVTPSELAAIREFREVHGLKSDADALRRMAFPARVV